MGFRSLLGPLGGGGSVHFRDGHEGCRALLTDINLGGGIGGWGAGAADQGNHPGAFLWST